MGKIIGIDLGTTTSEIAYLKDGKPEIIINMDGDRITPSVVGVKDHGEVLIGKKAKRQATLKPDKTAMEVKRLMGTDTKVMMGENEYLPQQISAMLLKYLKECAEHYLGEEVTEAVITVPAMFDSLQRQATKDAGKIAGLKVEQIINEPTAAALTYGLDNIDEQGKVLVYDLGGGTFDVTILEMYEGILEVKASRGNNALGGKDFDERLMQYIFDEFYKQHGIHLENNRQAQQIIKETAENAKIELSALHQTEIMIPFIPGVMNTDGSPISIEFTITRSQFESLIDDLIASTHGVVKEALKVCKLTEKDIDVVLAVGGSTRIPCVNKLLKDSFGNKVKTNINPDEAVALGAAVQAGLKSNQFEAEKDILITDTCQYSLGIEIVHDAGDRLVDGIFDPLINRDSTIPITRKKQYNTLIDNQTSVNIQVYQGEDQFAINNIKIGEFDVDGIPESPAGEQLIEVAFSYDLNGILQVDAIILSIGKKVSEIFNLSTLDDYQIEAAKLDLDMVWRTCSLSNKVKLTIESAEKKIPQLSSVEKQQVEALLICLKEAVANGDEKLADKYDEELTDLLFDVS